MRIRYATEEDVPIISDIHAKSWRAAYPGIVPDWFLHAIDAQDFAWESILSRQMRDARLTAQIVFDEAERQVGWVSYGLSRDAGRPDWGEILSMYLMPEYFGKGGYAAALMQAALKDFKLCRYANVLVWVFLTNARARRFYEKLGFARDDGERVLMFHDTPVQEVRYALSLREEEKGEGTLRALPSNSRLGDTSPKNPNPNYFSHNIHLSR